MLATSAFALEKIVTLEVATMACGPDPHTIKQALFGVDGVTQVAVSLELKIVTVTYDDSKVSLEGLMAAVATTGHASQSQVPVIQ